MEQLERIQKLVPDMHFEMITPTMIGTEYWTMDVWFIEKMNDRELEEYVTRVRKRIKRTKTYLRS